VGKSTLALDLLLPRNGARRNCHATAFCRVANLLAEHAQGLDERRRLEATGRCAR
jgi:hypothetical protein